jgi:hypothetical protein
MEPEGSSPHSQELFTCSYPEPDQSSPYHPILSLQDPRVYIYMYICKSERFMNNRIFLDLKPDILGESTYDSEEYTISIFRIKKQT